MTRRALLLSLCLAAGCSGIAFAAGLTVGADKLTIWSAATSISPVTCSLTPNADAWVGSTGGGSGTTSPLYVRAPTLVLDIRRSMLRFDVSSCSIPADAEVLSASFQVYLESAAAGRSYQVHRVSATWAETTLTYAQTGNVTGSARALTVATGWQAVDVTSDVAAFVAGAATNFGWRIRDGDEGILGLAQTSTLTSREGTAGQRPELDISYYP